MDLAGLGDLDLLDELDDPDSGGGLDASGGSSWTDASDSSSVSENVTSWLFWYIQHFLP